MYTVTCILVGAILGAIVSILTKTGLPTTGIGVGLGLVVGLALDAKRRNKDV